MNDDTDVIGWPSAKTLVRRAERSLHVEGLPGSRSGRRVPAPEAIVELEHRLHRFEHVYASLVPPGFESAGRLAPLKRLFKRVTRRFVWWYVEPRWTMQREATAELVGFARTSIQVTHAISAELLELRSIVHELEQRLPTQLD